MSRDTSCHAARGGIWYMFLVTPHAIPDVLIILCERKSIKHIYNCYNAGLSTKECHSIILFGCRHLVSLHVSTMGIYVSGVCIMLHFLGVFEWVQLFFFSFSINFKCYYYQKLFLLIRPHIWLQYCVIYLVPYPICNCETLTTRLSYMYVSHLMC